MEMEDDTSNSDCFQARISSKAIYAYTMLARLNSCVVEKISLEGGFFRYDAVFPEKTRVKKQRDTSRGVTSTVALRWYTMMRTSTSVCTSVALQPHGEAQATHSSWEGIIAFAARFTTQRFPGGPTPRCLIRLCIKLHGDNCHYCGVRLSCVLCYVYRIKKTRFSSSGRPTKQNSNEQLN